ncbi:hypothetical protein BUALT_Bualt02G0082200 [Buddleja alternifolia]|uniref:Steroid 5-alpha reductase C-terminal domain-containing protein n=1 Tax=Buddleja alternifolia TaxID=168488 RepID=A0AAV6Y5H5_9LAMI|nr:hypothetical protein BUALT_Bualt02G0082200 [Buddleja alternifolia]
MGTVIDSHFLGLTAIVTLGYQLLFFVITALLKFDKVTDFAVSNSVYRKHKFCYTRCIDLGRERIMALSPGGFVCACSHLGASSGTLSVDEWGEDRRFDEMRDNLGKLAVFWIFQAVWVWTVSLPVTVVNASDRNPSIQAQDIIGWIMWFFGLLVEATADQQKLTFKNSPENRGKWCNVGVWKYSRHPNYFGEIFLWWGMFVASTPVLENGEWLVIFGPIFLTLLLLFVSGIPLLEESADKKYGNVSAYRHYKITTSPLILLPPSLYGNLPSWFKSTLLFEFPLYSRSLPQESWNRKSKKGSDAVKHS